ncbi:MAG TPA: DNA-binding protein WhiA [Gaiellaceae bacterium]|nr:DNA-binding protein WhiA [Gaiellaceae bacterium]
MSLSDDLRDELAQIAPARRCCRLAELSALFHASGAWHLQGGRVAVHLDLSSSAGARRAFSLLRDLGVRSEIRTYRRQAFDRATRYQLHVTVDERALEVLRDAGVLSASGAPLEVPPKRVVGRSCCRGAYLRGALLGAGSLSGPRNPHLELRAGTIEGARFIAEVARREEIELGVVERRGHAVAYAKGHEAIADVLAVAGAGDTALELEEHAVLGAIRADANRLANADEANLERVAQAAHAQAEAIRAIGLDALPPELVEIAELRLRHPSASLAELAAKARPPLTKSAAHRRLQAVIKLLET